MPRNVAAKTSSRDPLKTVADALDTAVKAAKEGRRRTGECGVGVTSVTGSPFDAATLRQAEKVAEQSASVAQAAQARAIMALGISGLLLLISLASVIFAITKKLGRFSRHGAETALGDPYRVQGAPAGGRSSSGAQALAAVQQGAGGPDYQGCRQHVVCLHLRPL